MPRYNDYDFSLLENVTIVNADSPANDIYKEETPLTVEVGCGNGHFLTAQATAHPNMSFCGIDLKSERIVRCMQKVKSAELQNIQFIVGDAMLALDKCFADGQIARIYMTFPDPWPKKRHHKNRLFKPEFLDIVWNKLKIGGDFVFITDHEEYFEWSKAFAESDNRFDITFCGTIGENDERDYLTQSLFGEKWKREERDFYLLEFTKK